MSDDDVTLEMPMPLDSDGFLRRECPTCEREFKWLYTPEDEGIAAPTIDGGYFCPYCGIQVLGPMLKRFGDDIKGIGRSSGGMMSGEVKYDAPDELDPLTEVDDMTRVDFECHPTEPVKVLDDWEKPVRCLICGQPKS